MIRALALIGVGLALSGCSLSDNPTGAGGEFGAEVDMTTQLTFSPVTVTIKSGQFVRWRNSSGITHTATANKALVYDTANVHLPAGAVSFSGDVFTNGYYEHVFTTPGRYDYVCLVHEQSGMRGTVIVE
jgi:plastocyanin